MQVRTSTRQPAVLVGNARALDHHDPQQVRLSRPSPAPHTWTHRGRATSHGTVYPQRMGAAISSAASRP